MRQYEPIWVRIKNKNVASLVTPTANAARVIKAVIKEKHLDTGYKLMLSEQALQAKLEIVKENNKPDHNFITLHFSLTTTIKESYIGVNTL